jgi:hypothetical protein
VGLESGFAGLDNLDAVVRVAFLLNQRLLLETDLIKCKKHG